MSRPFGIELSCSSLKFCWTLVAVVSMIGESPVTVTVSCRFATVKSTFTLAVKLNATDTPSRLTLVKPGSSKDSV